MTTLLPLRRPSTAPSLARQLLLLQALVVAVMVVAATAAAYVNAQRTAEREAEVEVAALVAALTRSPLVLEAVTGPRPTEALQPYVEQVRGETGTSFITVMAPDRTRFTHPNPAQIGGRFIGTIEPALAGRTFTRSSPGRSGRRCAPPGRWSTRPATSSRSSRRASPSTPSAPTSRAPCPGSWAPGWSSSRWGRSGSWLVSRRLRRQTRGLGAPELARMVDYHQAVLHAVREGLLLRRRRAAGAAGRTTRRAALLALDGRPRRPARRATWACRRS